MIELKVMINQQGEDTVNIGLLDTFNGQTELERKHANQIIEIFMKYLTKFDLLDEKQLPPEKGGDDPADWWKNN